MLSHFLKKSKPAAAPQAAARARMQAPRAATLSVAALAQLAPHGHLRLAYPHVWERIGLFCGDPAHLNRYLLSLSIQQRDGIRAGITPQAMVEVADILAANQRFLAPPAAGRAWDADFPTR